MALTKEQEAAAAARFLLARAKKVIDAFRAAKTDLGASLEREDNVLDPELVERFNAARAEYRPWVSIVYCLTEARVSSATAYEALAKADPAALVHTARRVRDAFKARPCGSYGPTAIGAAWTYADADAMGRFMDFTGSLDDFDI